MGNSIKKNGMGWLPDYPSLSDYTVNHNIIKPMVLTIGLKEPIKVTIPSSADLRDWFSPVENQGPLGSCTANAGVGLIEYYERRAFGKHLDASKLFLYKTTRNLLHWTGDTGAFLRTTIGAMVLFGAPPEEYWPYITDEFDKEPSAFCYAFGQNYQTIKYFRLDPKNTAKDELLKTIKSYIAHGLPSMFGFTVYDSINQANQNGKIPYPCPGDKIAGGHAVVAVGYDDNMKIRNTNCGGETTGAIFIRNSWGSEWGENGYGWLPYDYIINGLAIDWWSILKKEWVDTGEFKL